MIKGFEPLGSKDANILILGSMPSVASLSKQEYYAHPQNRFWKLLAAIYDTELVHYESKVACLQEHQLILWDVIAECERDGSLDSKIKKVSPNALIAYLQQNPNIQKIILNGQKAGKEYQKRYGTMITIPAAILPSTSPANATCSFERLLAVWKEALTLPIST